MGDTVIPQSLIFGLACTEVLELYVVNILAWVVPKTI